MPAIIQKDVSDFMETNQMMIELVTLVFTPSCMGSI